MLSTTIVLPEDDEELALTMNGKKKKIKRGDFELAMRGSGMDNKSIINLFNKFAKALPKWHQMIDESFLPTEQQIAYHELIARMAGRLGIA